MFRLSAACQTYDWGKCATNSKVAALMGGADEQYKVQPNQPYAELWMGTHPKGPSILARGGQLLSTWLAEHPDTLGAQLPNAPNGHGIDLPFLFKVLSVGKALSIQVHPNKDEAAELHSKNPKNYPDPNHKPEMAIALTPFEMLCSFRPVAEVLTNLEACAELMRLVGGDKALVPLRQLSKEASSSQEGLKQCFSSLMKQPSDQVATQLKIMLNRLENATTLGVVKLELIRRLNNNYPGDVGCWAPFFMNHFILQPGEAVFLGPNEPHAYLSGDCIECMACSDNTVRAGLTPKFKDVDNLCKMLTYKCASPDKLKLKSVVNNEEHLTIYDPPVSEFCVHKIQLNNGQAYTLSPLRNCSILIMLEGEAQPENSDKMTPGYVGFVPARHKVSLSISKLPVVIYRAFSKLQ